MVIYLYHSCLTKFEETIKIACIPKFDIRTISSTSSSVPSPHQGKKKKKNNPFGGKSAADLSQAGGRGVSG